MTTPCLSRHDLESLLDDQLPEPRRTAAGAHLATCSDCQSAAEALIAALAAKAVPAGALSAAPLPASDGEDLASLLQHLKALRPDDSSDSFAGATVLDTPLCASGFVDDTEPNVVDSLRESSGKVADPALGTTIGPYTLTAELGHGGFGIVYRAEQRRPIRRTVALKLIKLGMDSREIIARFDAERQALALMDHPNIARIIDAGTTGRDVGRGSRVQGQRTLDSRPSSLDRSLDSRPSALDPPPGRPYFVMELVDGAPLTDYCDAHRLSIKRRLELFITVCQAVQHAHQKGIIHRDLKPSNVMVAERDGAPVVKVIDFGIAKALGASLGDGTAVTAAAQMIGTPLYMSPEQVGFGVTDVDTRSDVYSLGVLLYELLTGTTPFEKSRLQQSDIAEWQRIVREEEPPRPSARLTALNETATTVAQCRETTPRELSRNVRGDLDWIVLKALEKERDRRYESVSALARDLERLLANEPVEACPPSRAYRLRKFVRRNRALLATATTVMVALLVGTSAATWQAVRANHERARADEKARLAKEVVDKFYTEFADKWIGGEAGLTDVQREFLESAVAFYEELLKEESSDPAVQFDTAAALYRMGVMYELLSRLEEAKVAQARAIAIFSGLDSDGGGTAKKRFALSLAYYQLGFVQNQLLDRAVARQAYDASIALATVLAHDEPDNVFYSQHLGHAKAMLGILLVNDRCPDGEAEVCLREAVAIHEKTLILEPDNAHTEYLLGIALHGLGSALRDQGRGKDAEQAYFRALEWKKKTVAAEPSNVGYLWQLANTTHALGRLLIANERYDDALPLLVESERNAKDIFQRFPAVGRHAELYAGVLHSRGQFESQSGRALDAAEAYRLAVTVGEQFVREHPNIARGGHILGVAHFRLGNFLAETGDLDGAAIELRRAIALKPDNAEAHSNLGLCLRGKGELDAAIAECRRAIELKPDHANSHNILGIALSDKGDRAAAVAAYRRAIELQPDEGDYHNNLGLALKEQDDLQAAIAACRRAIELEPDEAAFHKNLANVFVATGDLDAAVAEFQRAAELNPEDPLAHSDLGKALLDKRDLHAAIAELRRAAELKPDDAMAHAVLASALQQAGRPDEAVAAFSDALRIQPDFVDARLSIGNIQRDKGDLAAAAAEYRRAIELKADDAVAHYSLAHVLQLAGHVEEAIDCYRDAIRIQPDYAEAYCNMGEALLRQGSFREGLAARQQGHELGSRNPQWPYSSGQWVREAQQVVDLDSRFAEYRNKTIEPADAAQQLQLANFSLVWKKDCRFAATLYRDALGEDPALADDLRTGHRYNAACAASLASIAADTPDQPLTDADRTAWRTQARDWLTADLEAWQALADSTPDARPQVAETLAHWQSDPDLAPLRDAEPLAQLPDAERQLWQALWSQVEQLRASLATAPAAPTQ